MNKLKIGSAHFKGSS